MTPIEIIALVVIIVVVIKLLVLLISPKSWMNFAKAFYNSKALAVIIGLVLAVVVLYYLIGGGITIVEILAVTAFVSMMFVIGFASEAEDIVKKYSAQIKRGKFWQKNWFYALLWLALIVWGFVELFF